MSVREQLRRKQQIRSRQIVPSMLRADWRVIHACSEAVTHGKEDATISRQLYEAYVDIMGRAVGRDEDGNVIVANTRFVDREEPREHLLCRGRRLYPGAA